MDGTVRIRSLVWFATGVVMALVAALLVMHAWRADAAPGDSDATFVPITPCRLFDTRPAPFTVGSRTAPLGPKESYSVQVTGNNGQCVGIPGNASAVAMNVTALQATATTYVGVVPGNVAGTPSVSSLNTRPGAPPAPNKVDVRLAAGGKVRVYNNLGTIHVLGDIVGFYTGSTLQDLDSRIPIVRHVSGDQTEALTAADEVVRSVTITAPRPGTVLAQSTAPAVLVDGGAPWVRCTLTSGSSIDVGYDQLFEDPSVGDLDVHRSVLSGQRAFSVAAGQTLTVNLVCDSGGAGATVYDTTLTATFYGQPASDVILSPLTTGGGSDNEL